MSWPPRRILVGSDFSSAADAAHAVSESIARRSAAELHLLHVVQDPARMRTGYDLLDRVLDYARTYSAARSKTVDELCARAKKLGGPSPKVHVRIGDPVAQLIAFRKVLHAGLLVLGASGLRGFRRHVLGSVADRMIREPGCPLLLVNQSPPAGEFKRILVAVELPDVRTPALEMAVRIAHDLRGELVLLHALPARGYVSDRRHVELQPETAAARLQSVAASIDPTIPVQAVVRHGDPVESIRAAAHEFDAHLTVMGAERNEDGWPGDTVDRVARAGLPALLLVWPEPEPRKETA